MELVELAVTEFSIEAMLTVILFLKNTHIFSFFIFQKIQVFNTCMYYFKHSMQNECKKNS